MNYSVLACTLFTGFLIYTFTNIQLFNSIKDDVIKDNPMKPQIPIQTGSNCPKLKDIISLTSSFLSNKDKNILRMEEKQKKYLENCILGAQESSSVTLETILKKSDSFPISFPVKTIRCTKLLETFKKHNSETEIVKNYKNRLEENINSSYPLIHEKAISLILNFLEHKLTYGSDVEMSLYKNLGVVEFITRLFTKRAVQFIGPGDVYQLLSGKTGHGGWKTVGTSKEKSPLILKDCLSYDEMKISSLLAASSPSFFINDGNRHNNGVLDNKGNHQDWGIVIGAVGCRFEKSNVMEWQDMVVTEKQNTIENGYGPNVSEFKSNGIHSNRADWLQMWAQFYQVPHFDIWNSEINSLNYIQIGTIKFATDIYKKRCKILAETILLEANERGIEKSQRVFLHVVGFGLGVWRIGSAQESYYLDAFADAISELNLPNLSDVYFSWIDEKSSKKMKDGEIFGDGATKIHFGKRNPHDRLQGEHMNKLLVVTYAWDGNSLPGNEFWGGSLAASGDPAQACSSQIAELQNPHINPKISGDNLRIASATLRKIIPLSEFVKSVIDQESDKSN